MGRKSTSIKNTKKENLINWKTKECKVISYNNKTYNLDINFDGYGIRIKNIINFTGEIAIIDYCGTVGKPDFQYFLHNKENV